MDIVNTEILKNFIDRNYTIHLKEYEKRNDPHAGGRATAFNEVRKFIEKLEALDKEPK